MIFQILFDPEMFWHGQVLYRDHQELELIKDERMRMQTRITKLLYCCKFHKKDRDILYCQVMAVSNLFDMTMIYYMLVFIADTFYIKSVQICLKNLISP